MRKLREQHWTQIAIAQELGVSEQTVQSLLALPDLPETPPRRRSLGRSILDPYKQLLLEWWNAGLKQPQMLLTLLRQERYTGSDRTLTRYISQLREAQGLPPTRVCSAKALPKVIAPQLPPLTARRAAFLIIKPEEERDSEDTELLAQLVTQHQELALAVELAEEFLQLLRQQ